MNNANQWRSYEKIDMTYLHVTLGAHLELRVEAVVSISQPRVSSTSACEIDQANEQMRPDRETAGDMGGSLP